MPLRRCLFAGLAVLWAGGVCLADGKVEAYKWVDEHGEVHYGDSIPPQYAQQATTMLNSQGVAIGHKDALKSAAQLAAEAAAKAAADKQKQHDNFLLATYTSVKDIEQLRDERLDQIHGQRIAAEAYVQTLSERLGQLQARAQEFRPYNTRPDARKMPDDLAEQMVHTMNDIKTEKAAMLAGEQEEASVRDAFQSDIDRFQQLRTLRDTQ
ncbi:MAG TPA: DUF4124 domain-containing protein [Steroidobacteraceae bacterium]|nr:DUF4124 domain-containing protein [Steroidobacteraceae bacterium]